MEVELGALVDEDNRIDDNRTKIYGTGAYKGRSWGFLRDPGYWITGFTLSYRWIFPGERKPRA